MEKFSSKMFIISVLLVFSFAALLLIFKKISVSVFVVFVLIYLVVAFVLYKKDEIDEIKTKWFEMKTLRREIYAKVEELEKLEKRVNKSEKDVNDNKVELQQMIRQYIRLQVLILAYRNRFPMPDSVIKEINKELTILTKKAFDTKVEAEEFVHKVTKEATNA